MARMPGVTYDQGAHIGNGSYAPIAGICHRTQGHWPGDYQIGKHTSGPPDFAGFHFLVGEEFGLVVQLYDTDTRCNHAAGANGWAIGIEFSGMTGTPLTEWQIAMGGEIVRWVDATHHIPATWYDGPRIGEAPGWRGHISVLGSDHTDTITRPEFDRLVQTPQTFTPAPSATGKEPVMVIKPGSVPNAAFGNRLPYYSVKAKQIVGFNGAPIQGGRTGYGVSVIDVPSSEDLTGLTILGDGTLVAACDADGGTFTYGTVQ
jgi:hypothetical protein